MQPSVQQSFLQFTKPLEGTVNYMYLDITRKVTVGVGNLIDPVGSALTLPFVHNSDNSPASQSEIQAEWSKVKSNTSLAQQGYKAAAPPFTTLHLPDAAISQLITNQLNANQAILKQTFTSFESWPADAQLGLLSMAWALGAGFTSSWPKFKAACLAQDWASAAKNCQISTTGNPGVAPRNTADVLLFNNAQAVASQKLDFSVLHWPNTVAAAPSSGSGTDGASPLSSGSGSNGSGAGSAKDGASSGGDAQSTGSGSATDSGSDPAESSTTGDDSAAGGDDSTSTTADPSDSSTTGDDSTSGTANSTGADSTAEDSNAGGDDASTGADSSSDPTDTSSSDTSGDDADTSSSTSDSSDESSSEPAAVAD